MFFRRRRVAERQLPAPAWERVRPRLVDGEHQAEACAGWTVGMDIDHPCAVYLTDRAIYVDITPQTLAPGETFELPLLSIAKCGIRTVDGGMPHLVLVFQPSEEGRREELAGLAVDLRPSDRGWKFGRRVVATCQAAVDAQSESRWRQIALNPDAPVPTDDVLSEIGALQEELAHLMAEPAPLPAEIERITEVLVALHEHGARADANFISQVLDRLPQRSRPPMFDASQEALDAWQRGAAEEASGS